MANEFDGEVIGLTSVDDDRTNAEARTLTRLRWKNGFVVSREELPSPSEQTRTHILPTLFDPQVNGFAGVDFQQDDLSTEQLLHTALEMRRHACSRILLTLITDEWPRLMKRLAHIKRLRDANPILREGIAGWHIEGPFLSSEEGYRGAHNPELMIDPTLDHIRELRDVTGNDPVLLTLAPERKGSLKAVEAAAKAKIKLSFGHTNASSAQLEAANMAAGFGCGFTHLGNGCPRTLDRQDNIIWRVLNTPLTAGVIPDGIHVSQDLFNIIHGVCRAKQLYFTTDAMSAAGAPPGTYDIGKLRVDVGADGIVRLPGSPYFAGSALTPLQGVSRAQNMLESDFHSMAYCFSWVASRFMEIQNHIRCGYSADFLVVQLNREGKIESGDIYIRGEKTPLVITH